MVIVEKIRGALRLCACDRQAASLGLHAGLTLADARARMPNLVAVPADIFADAQLMERLAAWCEQFTPLVALDPPHGLALDITGCAHLFGGEAKMRAHIVSRLARLGFSTRAALGTTPDAARAFARFGAGGGDDPRALPIAALEAAPETLIALKRAGLTTLGDLDARPSSALTARFGVALTQKLARILGQEDIRLTPLRAPAPYLVEKRFAEPLIDLAGVEPAVRHLFEEMAWLLEQRGEGGRAFEISFFRTDAVTRCLVIETGRPARDPKILLRLYREKIDALKDPLDPGFGFDLIRLAVTRSEKFFVAQNDFTRGGAEDESVFDALIDRLAARFGRERVLRFAPRDTHDPSRASSYVYFDVKPATPWPQPESGEPPLRPL
ncbi:MAG: DNA polymerase Y family protein, partial [Methylocystis sp.]|nr:DNA polymerase Y family protein [Methylocystis sp.]